MMLKKRKDVIIRFHVQYLMVIAIVLLMMVDLLMVLVIMVVDPLMLMGGGLSDDVDVDCHVVGDSSVGDYVVDGGHDDVGGGGCLDTTIGDDVYDVACW